MKNIFKYLRRTRDIFLIYGESDLKLKGYTNSSCQSDSDDSKLISRYVFTLYGGAVSWKNFKQQTVADSVIKVEYIAASEAAKEDVWMKKFITKLDMISKIEQPVPLYCNNTAVVAQAKEPRSHHKSKHILRRFHLIRKIVKRCDVIVDIKNNIADPFTKALSIQ